MRKIKNLEQRIEKLEQLNQKYVDCIDIIYGFLVSLHIGPDRYEQFLKENGIKIKEEIKNAEPSKTRMDESDDAIDS